MATRYFEKRHPYLSSQRKNSIRANNLINLVIALLLTICHRKTKKLI